MFGNPVIHNSLYCILKMKRIVESFSGRTFAEFAPQADKDIQQSPGRSQNSGDYRNTARV